MPLIDPILHYYDVIGYQPELIQKLIYGEKYFGCLLHNGDFGVCATLGRKVEKFDHPSGAPDPYIIDHRIILNAFFNARLNIENKGHHKGDIFDVIRFDQYKKIVMIGYFAPLVEKFAKASIDIDIFDLKESKEDLVSMEKQDDYIRKADAIILSSTTISNNSFIPIIKATTTETDTFLLGPSSILHPHMLSYPSIKSVSGMVFRSDIDEVIKLIIGGHGTRVFGKLGQKVNI